MGGFAFLAAIVIASMGMMQNIKYGGEMNRHYLFFPTLIGGFAASIALIGLVMTLNGGDQSGMFIGGLAVALIVHIPHIRQAVSDVTKARNLGMPEYQIKKLGPVPVLIRLLMVGIGKVMHLIMVLTIIGIPLYRMLQNGQAQVDAFCDQVDLRNELILLEEVEKAKQRQQIADEANQKVRERAEARKEADQ